MEINIVAAFSTSKMTEIEHLSTIFFEFNMKMPIPFRFPSMIPIKQSQRMTKKFTGINICSDFVNERMIFIYYPQAFI
jgi:hypothetical protein